MKSFNSLVCVVWELAADRNEISNSNISHENKDRNFAGNAHFLTKQDKNTNEIFEN